MKSLVMQTCVGFAALVLTLGAVTLAQAGPITYTFSATGNGSLGL